MAVTTTTLSVKDGGGTSQSFATLTDPAGVERAAVSLDTPGVAAYRACAASAAVITTTAKTILSIQGSATKTVRIKKIGISLTAATNVQGVLNLMRTSTQGTGGTAVAPTIAKLDSGTVAAATAVVQHYTTGAQSQGTTAGLISSQQVIEGVTTTITSGTVPVQMLWPESGITAGQNIVLRGTADYLEVQTATAIGTTPALSYFVEWEEDPS